MTRHTYPSGTLARDHREVALAPDGVDWHYTGLDVFRLEPGIPLTVHQGEKESIIVPLAGALTAAVAGHEDFHLKGRPTPWGVTDVLYLPVHTSAALVSTAGARVALPWAIAHEPHPVQYVAKEDVPSELRGAGLCSRQVNNFGTSLAIDADRLIACEVMQPGGNWSSYPPHKHDSDGPTETILEEIYYFEVARSTAGTTGFGLQRVYSSATGEIDITEEVRSGDVITIPYGYHGPTIAAPGHDLYYLNVMAGPITQHHPGREWLITDAPAHPWVRDQWADEEVATRRPLAR